MNWVYISQQIAAATEQAFTARTVHALSGGDINQAFCLQDGQQRYFVKLNRPELLAMFVAEYAGLKQLAATDTVSIPTPITYGQMNTHSFLVLAYIELRRLNAKSERLLGQQLARLHQYPQPFFGWHRDNTIGCTAQHNLQNANWLDFWRTHRLGFQLQLAAHNGYGGGLQKLGERLCEALPAFFADYQPTPSLLHGDLWAGNTAMNKQGVPVIFDPACYYGDREADLAMTELFGGFGADFYAAYQDTLALHEGYTLRKALYNLYHILNHLNLFGGSYLTQAENSLYSLLAEVS